MHIDLWGHGTTAKADRNIAFVRVIARLKCASTRLGVAPEQLLERMVELSLYAEEKLLKVCRRLV